MDIVSVTTLLICSDSSASHSRFHYVLAATISRGDLTGSTLIWLRFVLTRRGKMFSVDTLAKVEKLQICLQRFKKEEQAMAFGRRKVGGWGKLNNESASREKRTASHG